MAARIAILGASGAVGTALAAQILRAGLLGSGDELLLVGHGVLDTERRLRCMRTDLLDAFDDLRVGIEVVPNLRDVEADIVVIAAGARSASTVRSRRDLGALNHPIFQRIADQCVPSLSRAFFVVVSNPVELAVRVISSAVGSKRVVGMGAQQDSLRFARAIAADLGIRRRQVRASVLGEHGPGMVPLWSSVELMTRDPLPVQRLVSLRARSTESPLESRVATLLAAVSQLVSGNRIAEAYDLTRRALPDARIFAEPYITFHCLRSTPNATANAVVQIIAAIMANDHRRVHGQVALEGEVLGLHGVCGVPLSIGEHGWHAEPMDWLNPDEVDSIRTSTASIEQFISATLRKSVDAGLQVDRAPEARHGPRGCHEGMSCSAMTRG